MSEENQIIAIMNKYPPEKFNLLIPVTTLQELSPLRKLVVNTVMISSDLKDKDVYKQNGELALTKKGLEKLMTASNIQIVQSQPITPKVCRKCIEVAKATKIAPKCGECKSKNDVAYQVTVSIPDPSGQPRYVIATKNSRYDECKSANEKLFLDEQCETKALNRALRKAMMIKSTYTAEELKKPFVVAYMVPNENDPDMKKAIVQRYAESAKMLFPSEKENGMPVNAKVEILPEDEETEKLPEGQKEDVPEKAQPSEPVCEECGQIIQAGTGKWTIKKIVAYSKEHFNNKVLCIDCQNEARKKAKK